jgi:hypothetical protein
MPQGILATIIFIEIEKHQRLDRKSRGSQRGTKALRGIVMPQGILATIIFIEFEKHQRLDKKSRGSLKGTREGPTAM